MKQLLSRGGSCSEKVCSAHEDGDMLARSRECKAQPQVSRRFVVPATYADISIWDYISFFVFIVITIIGIVVVIALIVSYSRRRR
jgi:hypothetical protein